MEIAARPVRVAPVAVGGVVNRTAEALAPWARQPLTLCPELDCVRSFLPPGVIAAAERRSIAIGVGAERVLIASGVLTEEQYVAALARYLGVPFEPLDDMPRAACPEDDDALLNAPVVGMLPLQRGDEFAVVVAPRNHAARRLCLLSRSGRLPYRVHLTTSKRLQRFVDCHGAKAIARKAADELKTRHPHNSAAHRFRHAWTSRIVRALSLVAVLGVASTLMQGVAAIAIGCVFFAWTALRLAAATTHDRFAGGDPPVPDRELPVYTILIALYREAAVVPRLVSALDALDYPPEKLDIKLIVEADDTATRAAIARLHLSSAYHIIVAPAYGPRTKPKALNAALPFARGSLTAVFDAEDRPDPDQLRRAVARFWQSGQRLACLQARLTIDNTADNWLTRLFTAEYCGLFDVLLPALARWRLPLPLGGTSNHFRTDVLRKIGAWDPYNVTEDADLGMRLSRLGYETSVIGATTYEEAPGRLSAWINQRTRWFKGWMQTWLVHMRTPMTLMHDMGVAGFVTFQLLVGGTALAALVHPIFLAALAIRYLSGGLAAMDGTAGGVVLATLYGATFIAGYLATLVLAWVGLARRKLLAHAHTLLLIPVLWILLSVAAWRALIQLSYAPYRWDKTEHGFAKTSRQRRKNIWPRPPSSSPGSVFG